MPGARVRFLFLLLLVAAGSACREEGDIRIASLSFEGIEQVDEGALKDALQTKEGSWLPWGRQRYFDRTAFDADLRRIEAFYRDRGFPEARVRSFDVALNDTQDEVDVSLQIFEGEPVRVAEIRLSGFEPLSEGELDTLRQTLPLQPERPLDRQLAIASRDRAINVLRDKGYAYADVSISDKDVGPNRRDILLDAEPGTLAQFGNVAIQGFSTVDEHVIRRQLTFAPGDRFTRQQMRNSQRKLYGLELFEFVNIESLENLSTMAADVPVQVTVAEAKHQRVTTGLGYGTEEHGRARLRWEHLNFFGGAQQAGFEGKWSSLDRGVRLDYLEPYFLAPNFSLQFDGQAWQAKEPVFGSNQLGGRATLRYQATPEQFWSVSLINEYQRSSIEPEALEDFTVRDDLIALGLDPRDGTSRGTLSAIALDFSRNTTNSLLDARTGYVVTAHLEQAGKWLWGTYNYWSASLEGRHYLPVGRRLVIANRLRVGSIKGEADVDASIPFYKRYFLGGATSVRGWGRYEVSPLSGFGFPIGGLSMLEGSSEVRLPVWGNVGAVAFVDYGNVWSQAWELDVRDLRVAVGPGLRYLTPIGPARLDLGYQVNPIEGLLVDGEPQKRRWRIHFSIGQAF
jgi:outer membrane protein assembly complex protein YaeT